MEVPPQLHTDRRHDSALRSHFESEGKVVRDWARLCQRIAAAIEPERLRLILVANAHNVGAVTDLMKPMHSPPRLRVSAIFWSRHYL